MLVVRSSLLAQLSTVEEAEHLATNGNYQKSEALYSQALNHDPNNVRALLGRGYVRSWQQQFVSAQNDFLEVLESDSKNTDALVGLAYTLAWSERHSDAKKYFRDALMIDSSRLDARKGLAFIALWSGDYDQAIHNFSNLLKEYPKDGEISASLGNAYLAANHQKSARRAFLRTLSIAPERTDARRALQTIRDLPPSLEFSLWGGISSFSDDTGLGVRAGEVAFWPNSDTRLWFRYDNTLSMDNPLLLRENTSTATYLGGVIRNFGSFSTSKVEVGIRSLPGDLRQMLYSAEQVIYPNSFLSLKLGGLLADREDNRTDINIYSGIGTRLNTHFYLEPIFSYVTTNSVDENEWRLLLNSEYRITRALRLGGGFAFGRRDSEIDGASGRVASGYLMLSVPIAQAHWGYLLFRHESLPAFSYSIASVGLKFRLETR
jgi:tetratricopeptide (TPR) repeat protein